MPGAYRGAGGRIAGQGVGNRGGQSRGHAARKRIDPAPADAEAVSQADQPFPSPDIRR